MGRLFKEVLPTTGAAAERVYGCAGCHAHLSSLVRVVSKAFQGRNGRAFLFSGAFNVTAGPREERQLMTGLHVVTDLYCAVCQQPVGWKYLDTAEESQRYKIGKVILERAKLAKEGPAWGAAGARDEEDS